MTPRTCHELVEAHDLNDEAIERIYVGRRFHNDTERLERLFELYARDLGRGGFKAEPYARRVMDVSGTLHLYSGDDRELFFTFDDEVARDLYSSSDFDIDDRETRRVYISVGTNRFINRRTLSFSRKQSEIKVSLCKPDHKRQPRRANALV